MPDNHMQPTDILPGLRFYLTAAAVAGRYTLR